MASNRSQLLDGGTGGGGYGDSSSINNNNVSAAKTTTTTESESKYCQGLLLLLGVTIQFVRAMCCDH